MSAESSPKTIATSQLKNETSESISKKSMKGQTPETIPNVREEKEWAPTESYYKDMAKFKRIPVPTYSNINDFRMFYSRISKYLTKVRNLKITEGDIVNAIFENLPSGLKEDLEVQIGTGDIFSQEFTVRDLQKALRDFGQPQKNTTAYVLARLKNEKQEGSLQDYVNVFDRVAPYIPMDDGTFRVQSKIQNRADFIQAFLYGLKDCKLSEEGRNKFFDGSDLTESSYSEVRDWVLSKADCT